MGLRIEPLRSVRGFRLIGDLDLGSSGALRETLASQLQGTLVLDLFDLGFMDDGGLGTLAWAIHRMREGGGTLVLWNPPRSIRRVLEVTGLAGLSGLRIDPPEDLVPMGGRE